MRAVKLSISILLLACVGLAQEAFDVQDKGKHKWPAEDAQKIYTSACTVVEREFGIHHNVRPRFTLVLGADENGLFVHQREIRLSKWDPYLFAQGVVMLAFDDLMTLDERLVMSKRAMTWADSTVDATPPGK
jgi:hypothetical protein